MTVANQNERRAVAERLEYIRRSLGVGQEEIAERLGCGMTAHKWNNYAKGRGGIPVRVAIELCKISGVDLDYIYRGELDGLAPDVANRITAVMRQPLKRFRRAKYS